MPLLTLNIPRPEFEGLGADADTKTIGLCNEALKHTLDGLGISAIDTETARNDHEYRINVGNEITKPSCHISFTCGSDEYKTGQIFAPPKEQVRKTGLAVYDCLHNSALKVQEVVIDAWAGTTFFARPEEPTKAGILPTYQEIAELEGREIKPIVRLTLSPDVLQSYPSGKEGEAAGGLERFESVGQEILRMVAETFQLPEQKGELEMVYPYLAETDISLDLDLPGIPSLSEEARIYLVGRIEVILNSNESTKKGSATIWVRPGRPEREVIKSSR